MTATAESIKAYLQSHGATPASKIQRDLKLRHEEIYAGLVALDAQGSVRINTSWQDRNSSPAKEWEAMQ